MANQGQNPFQNVPVVVKNIIIINVLVVLVQFVLGRQGIDLGDYLGLHYWMSPKFRWWQVLTHIYMHGSPNDIGLTLTHIFFNMYGLFMFGSILENMWGPKKFFLFYMVCGIGAAFCHLGVMAYVYSAFHADFVHFQQHASAMEFSRILSHNNIQLANSAFIDNWTQNPGCSNCVQESVQFLHSYYMQMLDVGMVGASGAIFGILFAFGYLFPNTELYIMFIPVPIKAKWAVAGYAAIELFSGVGRIAGDNVAHFAHLGGMLFAFILLSIWKKTSRNEFY
ncbi:MAG: rhomboid family intramembrane serine protease [Taibaiella sp.]|nr:rhomboid family intramembrane serine protease [Taibaiella sp.]